MKYKDYDIREYSTEFTTQIAELEKYLWGGGVDENIAYFKWKYKENPITDRPIAVVALHAGKVVGFRGCFVSRWTAGERREDAPILCMGDTCVHPGYRRKGLFRAMTMVLMELCDNAGYKVFLNLSSNEQSRLAHLKMGWVRLSSRTNIRRSTLVSSLNYILKKKARMRLYETNIDFGRFGDIEVSSSPRPAEMCSIAREVESSGANIGLLKDEVFFGWRFKNNRRRYVFYYLWHDGVMSGYVVLRISDDNSIAHVIDYAGRECDAIYKILSYSAANRHFDILTIWDITLDRDFLKMLEDLNFKKSDLIGVLEKRNKKEQSILIRPVKNECAKEDWFINGVDIRRLDSWKIDEICSDAN